MGAAPPEGEDRLPGHNNGGKAKAPGDAATSPTAWSGGSIAKCCCGRSRSWTMYGRI